MSDATLNAELVALSTSLARMSERCTSMVEDSVGTLLGDRGPDPSLAAREQELDDLEAHIDEQCLRILARWRPRGATLRLVTAAMKLVVDLERVGDLAVNIAERTRGVRLDDVGLTTGIGALSMVVGRRLRGAVAAVVARDGDAANALLTGDVHAHRDLADRLVTQLVDGVTEGGLSVADGLALASVARYLARVGDHANNIVEMAVFHAGGDDVRHPRVARPGPP